MNDLMEEINNDLTVNHLNLSEKLFISPNLHSKYLSKYFKAKAKLNKLESELAKLYKERYHYYTFEYHKKLESSKEITFHILGDDTYSQKELDCNNQKLVVDVLDRTLKKIMYLTQDIKTAIEYIKYLNGC